MMMKKFVGFLFFSFYLCSAQGKEKIAGLDECRVPERALLPDMMTVVPRHLNLQNLHQREIIRFSNGIANLGEGLWWLEPEFPEQNDINQTQSAFQVFADSTKITDNAPPADSVEVLGRCKKGDFEFHPSHNHWHINNVAEFKVCTVSDFENKRAEGHPDQCRPVLGYSASVKVTFCLIDWYKLGDNTNSSDPTRNFWDCATSFQGISPGWVDQYHHSTPDQQIDITGLKRGEYYIVTTSNHNYIFEESDKTNNTSWIKIELTRESNGNPKITELETACDDDNYYQKLESAVSNFTTDDTLKTRVLNDMCGNAATNK